MNDRTTREIESRKAATKSGMDTLRRLGAEVISMAESIHMMRKFPAVFSAHQ